MDPQSSREPALDPSLAALIDRTAIAVTGAFLTTASIGVAMVVAAVAVMLSALALLRRRAHPAG